MTDIHLMAVLDSLKNIFHKGGGDGGLGVGVLLGQLVVVGV